MQHKQSEREIYCESGSVRRAVIKSTRDCLLWNLRARKQKIFWNIFSSVYFCKSLFSTNYLSLIFRAHESTMFGLAKRETNQISWVFDEFLRSIEEIHHRTIKQNWGNISNLLRENNFWYWFQRIRKFSRRNVNAELRCRFTAIILLCVYAPLMIAQQL